VKETLIAAVRRGVAVEVMVPGAHLDSTFVRAASRHRWGRLLENNVRIFEYQPTMYHRKVMIIDDLWVSVGSANFDNRSFRLNDEANLNVFDREFAMEESAAFAKDKRLAREITWEQWKRRPMMEKVGEATVGLLRSQL
jgi:cardiolipin synthase